MDKESYLIKESLKDRIKKKLEKKAAGDMQTDPTSLNQKMLDQATSPQAVKAKLLKPPVQAKPMGQGMV